MKESGETKMPEFVSVFLSDLNLSALSTLMTTQLREATENQLVQKVEWSDALLDALLAFADRYRTSPATPQVVAYANFVFADQMLSQNESRYYETSFWRRWCEQGIPDPNNIALPLESERTDFTVETSGYMLSDPTGYQRFPQC
jgi:hypothetical protein